MAEMIIIGAFTLGGFFLGAIVTILGVIAGKAEDSRKSRGAYVGIDRVNTEEPK